MPLDETSIILGELRERVQDIPVMSQKIDKILDRMDAMDRNAAQAHDRIDVMVSNDGPIKRLESGISDYYKTKKRAIIAMLGISAAGTGGAATTNPDLLRIIKSLLGAG